MLDATKPQNVSYCFPFWARDEQIKLNIQNVKERIAPCYELRTEPCAIVCYGPTLNDTWEKVRDFKYVMTCSGAHRFLIDRGIVPTWHVEVDPREHKCLLVGEPHKDVEYLVASACSPKLFEHLNGYNVKMWHVFDTQEEGLRILPNGEWALFGGCGAGLRCMVLARFLGFTEQHIFGMDGCESDKYGKHAGAHPNQPKSHELCEYGGRTWKTTPAMLEAARQTPHEMNQLPDVKATFYGDGLVQAMMKDHKPSKVAQGFALSKKPLISEQYRKLNTLLHQTNIAYGVGGARHAPTVKRLCESLNTTSVLDYGCGKGYLAKELAFPIWEYDPAIPGKDASPRPADIVLCTDVLEHIEPDCLHAVLADLRRCMKKVGYFVIHTGPAHKTLADGSNTHKIQEGEEWWRKRLSQIFEIGTIMKVGQELHVVLGPGKKDMKAGLVETLVTGDRDEQVRDEEGCGAGTPEGACR